MLKKIVFGICLPLAILFQAVENLHPLPILPAK